MHRPRTTDLESNVATKRAGLRLLAATVVLCATVVIVSGTMLRAWRRPTLAMWEQVKLGDTEAEVLAIAGPPDRQYDRDSAPERYYIGEMAYRARPITWKVFIYRGDPDLTMFVWFDESGRVEDIFIGGS